MKYSRQERWIVLQKAVESLVKKHVDFSLDDQIKRGSNDRVLSYAQQVTALGLLYLEFQDGIHEGDGLRILRCWKFFTPLFRCANRKNYAIEAVNLQWQYVSLSPRQAMQLLWSRFINTHGRPGGNIPADLHINRACKTVMKNLGSNLTETSLDRVGKCIGPLVNVTNRFDSETGVVPENALHSAASVQKDLDAIVAQLTQEDVFEDSKGRKHKSFPKLTGKVYMNLKSEALLIWMRSKALNLK